MKQVTIVVPKGNVNLGSITGSFEILNRANTYWQQKGYRPKIKICVAGLVPELKLYTGLFSIHPIPIAAVEKTDVIIIPSVSYDYENIIRDNRQLITGLANNIKTGQKLPVFAPALSC